MSVSKAQKEAVARYDEKTYDRLRLSMRRDSEISKSTLRRYAESKGMSVNALILGLIEERIRNDEDFVI